jgi:hypothetical protein
VCVDRRSARASGGLFLCVNKEKRFGIFSVREGVFFFLFCPFLSLESPHTHREESAFLRYIEIEDNDYHDDDDDNVSIYVDDIIIVLERCVVRLIEEERNDDAFFKRKESLPGGVRRQKKRVFS